MFEFWQTTHRGTPRGRSHSPEPRGRETLRSSAEEVSAEVPVSLKLFRLLSLHSSMLSRRTFPASFGRFIIRVWRSLIHSCSCLIQFHGSDQSSRMTRRVLGIVAGVNNGCNRGKKCDDGFERVYMDKRARMSISGQKRDGTSNGSRYRFGLCQGHLDRCSPMQSRLRLVVSERIGRDGLVERIDRFRGRI